MIPAAARMPDANRDATKENAQILRFAQDHVLFLLERFQSVMVRAVLRGQDKL